MKKIQFCGGTRNAKRKSFFEGGMERGLRSPLPPNVFFVVHFLGTPTMANVFVNIFSYAWWRGRLERSDLKSCGATRFKIRMQFELQLLASDPQKTALQLFFAALQEKAFLFFLLRAREVAQRDEHFSSKACPSPWKTSLLSQCGTVVYGSRHHTFSCP